MSPLKFVTTGLGGYAADHIRAVQRLAEDGLAQLVGVVAQEEDRQRHPELVASLIEHGVVLYGSIEHFLTTDAGKTDVLMAAVGIHQHAPLSITAMKAGLHVYCEKPIAATIQEVDDLIAVQKETGKKVAIGFQYIPSRSIQELKARICDGRLGCVKAAKLMCCWPRSENYFARNDWAGKLRIGERWILDSPANNAHAHFLFNLLYLSSSQANRAANPTKLQAGLYRANHIESADLAQLRFETDTGARCFAMLSHCGWKRLGPIMHLQCEKGGAIWQQDWGETRVSYHNGRTEEFVNDRCDEWRYRIVRDFAISILENRQPICPPELARSHTLTINAMHESCPEINTIPDEFIIEAEEIEDYPPYEKALFRRVENHDDAMRRAFAEMKLFSELGQPWAQETHSYETDAKGYSFFPKLGKNIL